MKNPKINLNFSGYSDEGISTKSRFILDSVSDNPLFPNPVPAVGDAQDAWSSYEASRLAAEGLGKANVADKNKYRKLLEQLLVPVGQWVMMVANGDESTLVKSGFTLRKSSSSLPLANPGEVKLKNGNSTGTLVAAVARPQGSRGFLHQYSAELPTENTVWTSYAGTRCRYTFSNLLPGKQYWVRVAAVGANGQIAYSPVAAIFVQ